MSQDYYKVLGVDKKAQAADIRKHIANWRENIIRILIPGTSRRKPDSRRSRKPMRCSMTRRKGNSTINSVSSEVLLRAAGRRHRASVVSRDLIFPISDRHLSGIFSGICLEPAGLKSRDRSAATIFTTACASVSRMPSRA